MEDKILTRLSTLISIMGIILLFFAASHENTVKISALEDTKQVAQTVEIRGTITKISKSDDMARLTLSRTSDIEVTIFKIKDDIFRIGDNVLVKGKLEEYKGKTNLNAEKIMKEG